VAAVEMLWSVPLILIGVMAMCQYCMMLWARQQLLSASREGARVAARGADPEEVKSAVRRVLGCGRLGGATVETRVLHEDPVNPKDGRDRCEVWVRIPLTLAAPDLLGWVGLSLSNRELVACTVMCRE
jgi:hypothetical protein